MVIGKWRDDLSVMDLHPVGLGFSLLGRARTPGTSPEERKRERLGNPPAPALWTAKEESRGNSLGALFLGTQESSAHQQRRRDSLSNKHCPKLH